MGDQGVPRFILGRVQWKNMGQVQALKGAVFPDFFLNLEVATVVHVRPSEHRQFRSTFGKFWDNWRRGHGPWPRPRDPLPFTTFSYHVRFRARVGSRSRRQMPTWRASGTWFYCKWPTSTECSLSSMNWDDTTGSPTTLTSSPLVHQSYYYYYYYYYYFGTDFW